MNYFKRIIAPALKKSAHTSIWLLKLILPISLAFRLLDYSGLLVYIAEFLNPVFIHLGLPGSTAIVFITSIFLPLYAPLAIITSMDLTLRELTILALMCQVAHNLPVESAIQAKTGTSFWAMFSVRIFMSILIGFVLNLILPLQMGHPSFLQTTVESINSLSDVFIAWGITSLRISILIVAIVTILMVTYRLLEEYNLINKLSKSIEPILKIFGLPKSTAFLWLIGYIVGLAYGGALMIDQMKEGKVTKAEGSLLNYHLAISHSVLEDNLLFVALGVSIWWILVTRLIAAWLVVWMRRLFLDLKGKLAKQVVANNI
ncbi:MAG: nucleoside recognition domain-containing protein [Dysgonamonadaceae bacterium]|nr:nucleoside recognition domain-containing protein [Dysgonamonadaceae bacterium]MDD4728370.1 nucleoside recognition domain-containing protein [Dysgonamonadaceae bacterium]